MADPKQELQAYVEQWYTLFPSGNAAAMAALYTPDARLLLANLPAVSGNKAIGRFLSALAGYADMTCRHEVSDIDLIGDDTAIVTGAGWVDSRPRAGGDVIKDASRFLMVMRREPGNRRWLCHYDMSQHTPDIKNIE